MCGMQEKIIFVFPGQGAQYVGMCADVWRDFVAARYAFEEVSEYAGKNIAKLCFDGPGDELNKPENVSLATFAHSVSIARVIEDEFKQSLYKMAYAITGHSMGQYSALYCAGSMTMNDAVNLLIKRAKFMTSVGADGSMAAVVGLSHDQINQCLIRASGAGFAQISNHNAADQFIISGKNVALDIVVNTAKQMGARVAKKLNVLVPAHCGLMANAEFLLRKYMENVNLSAPKTNWYSNQTAEFMSNPLDISDALCDQITHGVRWWEIMNTFPKYNITRAYEIGPGRVLTTLINRANVNCVATKTADSKSVKLVLQDLAKLR